MEDMDAKDVQRGRELMMMMLDNRRPCRSSRDQFTSNVPQPTDFVLAVICNSSTYTRSACIVHLVTIRDLALFLNQTVTSGLEDRKTSAPSKTKIKQV